MYVLPIIYSFSFFYSLFIVSKGLSSPPKKMLSPSHIKVLPLSKNF